MTLHATQRIAFLGCGSMNESILAGLLTAGLDPAQGTATVRRSERAAELRERYGVDARATSDDDAANTSAVREADVVVLGVKPVGIVPLVREIAPGLQPSAVSQPPGRVPRGEHAVQWPRLPGPEVRRDRHRRRRL